MFMTIVVVGSSTFYFNLSPALGDDFVNWTCSEERPSVPRVNSFFGRLHVTHGRCALVTLHSPSHAVKLVFVHDQLHDFLDRCVMRRAAERAGQKVFGKMVIQRHLRRFLSGHRLRRDGKKHQLPEARSVHEGADPHGPAASNSAARGRSGSASRASTLCPVGRTALRLVIDEAPCTSAPGRFVAAFAANRRRGDPARLAVLTGPLLCVSPYGATASTTPQSVSAGSRSLQRWPAHRPSPTRDLAGSGVVGQFVREAFTPFRTVLPCPLRHEQLNFSQFLATCRV